MSQSSRTSKRTNNGPASGAAGKSSVPRPTPASPELAAAVQAIIAPGRVAPHPTLGMIRAELQKVGISWSADGELLFPQDRTALLIELDELIERHGTSAWAMDVLSR